MEDIQFVTLVGRMDEPKLSITNWDTQQCVIYILPSEAHNAFPFEIPTLHIKDNLKLMYSAFIFEM